MLVRTEEGQVYNLDHTVGLRIVEATREARAENTDLAASPYYVEVLSVLERGSWRGMTGVLARTATREEADAILSQIVKQSGGVDLGPEVSVPSSTSPPVSANSGTDESPPAAAEPPAELSRAEILKGLYK